MNFLKVTLIFMHAIMKALTIHVTCIFMHGVGEKKRYMLFENDAYRVNLNNNVVFADLSTYELWKNGK